MNRIQNALLAFKPYRLFPLWILTLAVTLTSTLGLEAHVYHAPVDMPANVREYVEENLPAARQIAKEYGIPVPIILAMAGLETGWGSSRLAREAKNHFGIKADDWSGPVYEKKTAEQDWEGKVYYVVAEFRKYESVQDSYRDFAEFIRNTRPHLLKIPNYAYERWAISLHKTRYATDISYSKKLINIIDKYELFRYTNGYEVEQSKATKRD